MFSSTCTPKSIKEVDDLWACRCRMRVGEACDKGVGWRWFCPGGLSIGTWLGACHLYYTMCETWNRFALSYYSLEFEASR